MFLAQLIIKLRQFTSWERIYSHGILTMIKHGDDTALDFTDDMIQLNLLFQGQWQNNGSKWEDLKIPLVKKKSLCLPDLACSSFFGLLSRWSSLLLVISQWTNCCLRKHKLLVLPITGNLNQLKFERFVNQTQLIFIDKKFETFELDTALSIFNDLETNRNLT